MAVLYIIHPQFCHGLFNSKLSSLHPKHKKERKILTGIQQEIKRPCGHTRAAKTQAGITTAGEKGQNLFQRNAFYNVMYSDGQK